jgi:hypothetical protein
MLPEYLIWRYHTQRAWQDASLEVPGGRQHLAVHVRRYFLVQRDFYLTRPSHMDFRVFEQGAAERPRYKAQQLYTADLFGPHDVEETIVQFRPWRQPETGPIGGSKRRRDQDGVRFDHPLPIQYDSRLMAPKAP